MPAFCWSPRWPQRQACRSRPRRVNGPLAERQPDRGQAPAGPGRRLARGAQVMRALFVLTFLLWSMAAHAHKPSDSYLTLSVEESQVAGQCRISPCAISTSRSAWTPMPTAPSPGERCRRARKKLPPMRCRGCRCPAPAQNCPLRAAAHLIDDHTDGAPTRCCASRQLCSGDHRQPESEIPAYFSTSIHSTRACSGCNTRGRRSPGYSVPDNADQTFSLRAPSRLRQFVDYLREGIWHIWIGFDHIFCSCWPCCCPRSWCARAGRWAGSSGIPASPSGQCSVICAVTAFTVAHSVTLTLATLEVISLAFALGRVDDRRLGHYCRAEQCLSSVSP